jgi:hypothetical protein
MRASLFVCCLFCFKGIWFLGNLLATYLSYPGSFKSVQRDIERDYSRRLAQKVGWGGRSRRRRRSKCGSRHAAYANVDVVAVVVVVVVVVVDVWHRALLWRARVWTLLLS